MQSWPSPTRKHVNEKLLMSAPIQAARFTNTRSKAGELQDDAGQIYCCISASPAG